MKPISGAMKAAISDTSTTLCRIWMLELVNGTIYRFTDLDRDIVFDDETYAHNPGIRVSAVSTNLNGAASNASITARAGEGFVSQLEARNGALDGSVFELAVIDYTDPDGLGKIELFAGSVREIKYNNKNLMSIELDGSLAANVDGTKVIGEVYSRNCRARFGDRRCKFDEETVKFPFAVSTVSTDRHDYSFVSTDILTLPGVTDDQFKLGKVAWVVGDNVGFTDEVKTNNAAAGKVTFAVPTRFPIKVGDVGYIYQGCDFTVTMCGERYNNLVNFRGEPYASPEGIQPEAEPAVDTNSGVGNFPPGFLDSFHSSS